MTRLERHIYPTELENKVIRSKRYIPRKMNIKERLKLNHRYWIDGYGTVRVYNKFTICNIEYYSIIDNNNMRGCISYPINENIDRYELLYNKNRIEDCNIINSSTSYTGAEIKFWFAANKIDLKNSKYSTFWSFVSKNSNIIDNKYYYAIMNNNIAKLILDKKRTRV